MNFGALCFADSSGPNEKRDRSQTMVSRTWMDVAKACSGLLFLGALIVCLCKFITGCRCKLDKLQRERMLCKSQEFLERSQSRNIRAAL